MFSETNPTQMLDRWAHRRRRLVAVPVTLLVATIACCALGATAALGTIENDRNGIYFSMQVTPCLPDPKSLTGDSTLYINFQILENNGHLSLENTFESIPCLTIPNPP